MSNQRLLRAPEAAFTRYETNSRAQVFELLSDEFTFELYDSMPYGGSYFGRDEFIGLRKAVAKDSTYFRYDVRETIAVGDTIVVPVRADAFSIHGIPLLNERLFLFKVKDGRAVCARFYAATAGGCDVISGYAHRHCSQPDLSDHTSPRIE